MIDWESLRAIVLDIEGTTCPVDFVTGSLFPYARQHLGALLSQADQQAPLKPLLEEVQTLGSKKPLPEPRPTAIPKIPCPAALSAVAD